jgi:prepilin-type N-terminal cleavage/methylation domain-containing protein
MVRRAFTLIELLVVIAIIAILAVILFPVFAQAKISAQKTTDLSNTRGIGLAMVLYETDFEDSFPTFVASYCENARIQNPLDAGDRPGGTSGMGRNPMWQYEIYPYLRSWSIFFAPGDKVPRSATARFHNLSYGYNYGYLSKLELTPDPSGCGAGQWFSSRIGTSVESPAATVAFADSAGAAVFGETPNPLGSMINPPDASRSTEKFYGSPESGWGLSCYNSFYGTQYAETDGFAPRYTSGGNMSLVDGHAKFYKTNSAATGTTFDPLYGCELTKVTNNSKYLWDPRGTSAPPE